MNQIKGTIDEIRENQTFTNEMRENIIRESCKEWGTTRRTVLEYLDFVEDNS